ncbi:hypothetical protein [Halothiobacillus sp. DCM-1]|uniref:hypothetical protein n=1 Tax=Halothiobacillus sp. DCM-1 TaxID=3112558 RepID=UPI003243A258
MNRWWQVSVGLALCSTVLVGCGEGGTATQAAAEAQAAKSAKADLDQAKKALNDAQALDNARLKQAEQQ